MKKWLGYSLLGLAAYLTALALTLPATQVYARFADRVPLTLTGISGTVWSGRASTVDVRGLPLEDFTWKFRFSPLLTGAVEFAVGFGNGAIQGTGIAGRSLGGDVYLEGLKARLLAKDVAPLVRGGAAPVEGLVNVDLDRVSLSHEGRLEQAQGHLTWNLAGLGPPADLLLGEYQLELETGEQGIRGRLSDAGGPIEASGTLSLQPDGAYRLDALLLPRVDAAPTLVQALRAIGNETPDGKIAVQFSGRLPLPKAPS